MKVLWGNLFERACARVVTVALSFVTLYLTAVGCTVFADGRDLKRPSCEEDSACDDGLICNGVERCDPEHPDADRLGCVNSEGDPADDGIACTLDTCDEEAGVILNDPAECACSSDLQCPDPPGDPCTEGICDPRTFTCTNVARPEGASCDDGVACTTGAICTAGRCLSTDPEAVDDGVCDDGLFCNGAERCAPGERLADPNTGCIRDTPPALDPANDDGIPCSLIVCDEDNDTLESDLSACECASPQDCAGQPGNPGCLTFNCGPETNYRCIPDRAQDLAEGAPCDDQIPCTVDDACDGAGRCLGAELDALCQENDPCTGVCTPTNPAADVQGCVANAPVSPAPMGCE